MAKKRRQKRQSEGATTQYEDILRLGEENNLRGREGEKKMVEAGGKALI